MPPSVEQLCKAIEQSKLMSSKDVSTLRGRWFQPNRKDGADAEKFCRWLVLNNYLTEFVVNVLRNGKADQLSLNQYRLRDRLTTGPMAGAYLGTDPLDRPVAIEVLSVGSARDPATLMGFQQVAEKALKLQHQNVARTLDVGAAHGLHYLVKECYEGDTLADVLKRRGQLPFLQAARIFALAFAGLQALHDHGVPAGDLGLDCLLLTAEGKGAAAKRTVKILHSGVKRRLFDSAAVGKQQSESIPDDIKLVSLFEMQLPDAEGQGAEADIFRLGCAFYECLTGNAPYAADVLPAPKRPAPPIQQTTPDVPDMLAQLVEQMIAPVPSQRPQKAAHIAKSLRVFLATEEEPRKDKAEENIVVSAPAAARAEQRDAAEDDDDEPAARRPGKARRAADSADDSSKLAELWAEIKPSERDLVFLSGGALALIVVVLFLKLITGLQFANLVFLLTGGALAYGAERFIRWRESE